MQEGSIIESSMIEGSMIESSMMATQEKKNPAESPVKMSDGDLAHFSGTRMIIVVAGWIFLVPLLIAWFVWARSLAIL